MMVDYPCLNFLQDTLPNWRKGFCKLVQEYTHRQTSVHHKPIKLLNKANIQEYPKLGMETRMIK